MKLPPAGTELVSLDVTSVMWTRKDAAEIADTQRRKRRKRFSPLWPLLITLGLALVEWIVRRNTARPFFSSWPVPAIWFLIVFGLLYFSRVAFGRYFLFRPSPFSPSASASMICTRCHRVQIDAKSHRCLCGGPLEPLDYWHWVDEDKAPAR